MDIGRGTREISANPFQGRAWRDLAQLTGEALAAGLLVSLVLAAAIFIAATQAQAAEPAPPIAIALAVAATSGGAAGGR